MKRFFMRLPKRLSSVSIQKQLFIIYVPLIFLATVVIGTFLVYDSTQQLMQNYKHLAALNTQRAKSAMFNTTNTFLNTSTTLSNDLNLRDLLTTNYQTENEAIIAINNYLVLNDIRDLQPSMSTIKIYVTNESIPNYTYFTQVDKNIEKTDWYKKAYTQSSAFWMTMPDENTPNHLFLFKSLPLPLSNEKAILALQLDYNFLSNQLRTSAYDLELQLNDDPLFYNDELKQVGNAPSFKIEKSINPTESMQETEGPLAIVAVNSLKLLNSSDRIYFYSIDHQAYNSLKKNVLRWGSIILVILVATLFIIILFARFFSNRIHKLQSAVYYASIEQYDQLQNVSGKDEVSKISLDFHKIIHHIHQKEEEIYRSKMLEQELLNKQQQMDYKLLASQINPHFLFNTLETIRMMSLKAGNSDAAYAIKLLGKSIRYTLEAHGTKLTTLEKSLEFVHTYVRIQRIRFGERVNYSYRVDNAINEKEVQMLPLLIQPLIENAISHGLEGLTSNGKIELSVQKKNDDIEIQIKDNGIGIPPEELQLLQKKILESSSNSKESIGLSNVNHRVKMYYGDAYGLTIKSTVGEGTTVFLLIKNISQETKTTFE